ncbi:hypothetical protein BsWGS_04242 [Bradybaena similaris]
MPDQGLFPYERKRYLIVSDGSMSSNSTTDIHKARMISVEEFWEGKRTGNSLIDEYGKNNVENTGELGRGVILTAADKAKKDLVMKEYNVNTIISDMIHLNRLVPDSRIQGCEHIQYNDSLPTASIIVTFHNEWPSILLRTVYSVINRTPRHLLKEIILVDDASTLNTLKEQLEYYIEANFPRGLVRLLRLPERLGLIAARMHGSRVATGDVLLFFDSHMEVNIEWLRPLLTEIKRERKIVAMATLDYIQRDTFEYRYNHNYLKRYGWDWRLVFFETRFREDQIGPRATEARLGVTMVGAAFAIDREYFFELGGYDEKMTVWGGENLEFSWRVWLCGGRLLHVPCSRIGHVARGQPYSFPGGRKNIEQFNYKRAISIWMGNYSRFVYNSFPDMKKINIGDISSRTELKSKLKCKEFKWYLQNFWPELNVPDENMTVWGQVVNEAHPVCLDNKNQLFMGVKKLYLLPCNNRISSQGFSLTTDNLLRISLQCVVVPDAKEGAAVKIEGCITGTRDKWSYLQDHSIVHQMSNLCLDVSVEGPQLSKCQPSSKSQKWTFKPIYLETI